MELARRMSFGPVPGSTRRRHRGMGLSHNPAFDLPRHSHLAFRASSAHRRHRAADARYAQAFQEVKEYGASDSPRRTEDQTAYASGGWNSRRVP